MMRNMDLRRYAKERRVNLWQVSEAMGLSHETAFSRMLRHELPDDKKIEIREIINKIASGQG